MILTGMTMMTGMTMTVDGGKKHLHSKHMKHKQTAAKQSSPPSHAVTEANDSSVSHPFFLVQEATPSPLYPEVT